MSESQCTLEGQWMYPGPVIQSRPCRLWPSISKYWDYRLSLRTTSLAHIVLGPNLVSGQGSPECIYLPEELDRLQDILCVKIYPFWIIVTYKKLLWDFLLLAQVWPLFLPLEVLTTWSLLMKLKIWNDFDLLCDSYVGLTKGVSWRELFCGTSFMRETHTQEGDSRQNENKPRPPFTKLPIPPSCIAPQMSLFTQSLNFLPRPIKV